MKAIPIIILVAWCGSHSTAQTEQSQFRVGSQLNNGGLMPLIEYRIEYTEKSAKGRDWTFGPRVGYTYDVFGNSDHLYFQQTLRYKGWIFSPFWLRRYDKTIGYQVPISLGYKLNNFELWCNYVYHSRTVDLHFTAYIK